MSKEIVTFDFSDGQIRAYWVNGEPWFVGYDVAKVLGYKDYDDAVRSHVPDKWKVRAGDLPGVRGQLNSQFVMINEAGLNRLIMKSTLPSAEIFQEWVCEVLLPKLRKGQISLTNQALELVVQNEPNLVTRLYEAEFRALAKKIRMKEADLYLYIYKHLYPTGTYEALDRLAPLVYIPGSGRKRRVISGTTKTVMLYKFLTELGIEHNKYQQGKLSTIMQLVETKKQFEELCEKVFGSTLELASK